MDNLWVAYAAIVATVALFLELRRFREERRVKFDVQVGTEEGTLPDSLCFAVVALNRSSFAVHVVRHGFTWGSRLEGLDLLSPDSKLIGEVGPLGARKIHAISCEFWKRALEGARRHKRPDDEYARAWVELSTGEKIYSRRFRCEPKDTGASLMVATPSFKWWERAIHRLIPTKIRWWLEDRIATIRNRD